AMQLVAFDSVQEDGWDHSVRQIFEAELERIVTDFGQTFAKDIELRPSFRDILEDKAHACRDTDGVHHMLETALTRPAIQAMLQEKTHTEQYSLHARDTSET